MKYHLKGIIPLHIQSREIVTNEEGFVTYDYDISKQKSEVFYLTINGMKKTILYECEEYPFYIINLESGRILFVERNFARVINLKNCKIESIIEVKNNEIIFRNVVFENTINYMQGFGDNVVFDGESGFIDLFTKQIIWKNYTLRNPHIKQGYLFDYMDEYFARYSTETGELLWKIDVSELGHGLTFLNDEYVGSVYDIICVYKGVVYVAFKSSRSAGIAIETGEVVWDMLDIYIGTRTPDIKSFALDTQREGILHGLWAGYYVEIDLNQRTRTQHYIRDMVESKNLEIPNTFTQNGKHLFYSSGALVGNDKNTIAAFNPSTKEIDWQYEFDLADAYTISQPLFGGKYMYVYDNNLRLHVFEKE